MYVTLTQGIECRPGISLPGRRSKRGRGGGGGGGNERREVRSGRVVLIKGDMLSIA